VLARQAGSPPNAASGSGPGGVCVFVTIGRRHQKPIPGTADHDHSHLPRVRGVLLDIPETSIDQGATMDLEVEDMETKQKMAIAGTGLIVGGIGLGIVGAALVAPALFGWTARLIERGADGLFSKVEGASKTVGTVAGTLHRSFNEAKRAGVAELRRGRSDERSVAG
jgi:hypothetical protein